MRAVLRRLGIAVLVACACAGHAAASEFVINPLRVGLDAQRKSGEFVVRNEGAAPLRMQLQAMRWTQDADGRDQYEADESLIYFPRAMEIPPGESRVVRVGVKAAPVSREDTYRLFVEELPPAALPEGGATLLVLLRVGVPVFVAPVQVDRNATIDGLAVKRGEAGFAVVNAGSVHVRADKVELAGLARDGTTVFEHAFDERYFLAGVTRRLRFAIPAETCGRVAKLEVRITGDNLALTRSVDVDAASCR